MGRLFAYMANDPDRVRCAMHPARKLLRVSAEPGVSFDSWGVGFYQGEVLLQRRPKAPVDPVDFYDLAKELRTDCIIGHVRSGTVGQPKNENTHPFRYRQWLFAHTGTVEAFTTLRGRLSDSLPQFLQRDVRGDTDSELLFHLFLSFLHDAGQLDRPAVDAQSARTALRSSIALVDRLCAEEGAGPSAMNILVSCPEYLLAVHGGAKMAYRSVHGRHDLERIFGDGGLGRMRIPDHAASRLTLVASDFEDDQIPEGWTAVRERAIVTFTRADEPVLENV